MGKRKGIYYIKNTENGKIYIGSTSNFKQRKKYHLSRLRSGNHRNEYLMEEFSKYGEESFRFELIEVCDCEKTSLREMEQNHIDMHDFDMLYNQSMFSTGGGADVRRIPMHVLDLKGNIVESFESGLEAADFLDYKVLKYSAVNTPKTFRNQYRVVTQEFHKDNLEIIKSWPRHKSQRQRLIQERKQRLANRYALTLIDPTGEETICKTFEEASKIVGVSATRVSQLLREGYERYKQYTIKDNIGSGKVISVPRNKATGISYNESLGKYMVYIDHKNNRLYLGSFYEIDEAEEFLKNGKKAIEENKPIVAKRRDKLTTIAA